MLSVNIWHKAHRVFWLHLLQLYRYSKNLKKTLVIYLWDAVDSENTYIIYDYVTSIIVFNSLRRVTQKCVSELTIIGSDNGLSPGRRQAIIWTNVGSLLIEPLGTNVSEISIGIHTFSFKKMHLKMSSAKWRPFCLGLNVLIQQKYQVFPGTSVMGVTYFHWVIIR